MDISFFKPLQTFYNQAIEKYLRTNPGTPVTSYKICRLFNEAYSKAATMSNAVNGFRKCGIWTCDRHSFIEREFPGTNQGPFSAPVEPDMSLTSLPLIHASIDKKKPSVDMPSPSNDHIPCTSIEEDVTPLLSTQANNHPSDVSADDDRPCTSGSALTRVGIRLAGVLNVSITNSNIKRRRKERSQILTSSLYKKELKEK